VPDDSTRGRMPGGLSLRVHHPGWKARSPRDLGAGWDFDDVRDHYLARLFSVDPMQLRYSNHDRYLALSRVLTGELMARAFGEWRSGGSACGGALVWFLRDLWAGAGWGLLDDTGRPKPCFHILKRVLQPRCVWFTDEGCNGLHVHVSNEHAEAWACELSLEVFRRDDVCIARTCKPLLLEPRAGLKLVANAEFDTLLDLSAAFRFGESESSAVVATLRDAHGELVSQAFHFRAGQPPLHVDDPGLSATALPVPSGWQVQLRSQRMLQAVHFEVEGHVAQDDYFDLAPHIERSVVLRRTAGPSDTPLAGWAHAMNSTGSTRIQSV